MPVPTLSLLTFLDFFKSLGRFVMIFIKGLLSVQSNGFGREFTSSSTETIVAHKETERLTFFCLLRP